MSSQECTPLEPSEKHEADFVLVYAKSGIEHADRRKEFEAALRAKGLICTENIYDDYVYVSITAPFQVLSKYCGIMKLNMPVTKNFLKQNKNHEKHSQLSKLWEKLKPTPIKKWFPEKARRLLYAFDSSRTYLFDADEASFFTPIERMMIVNFILERTSFGGKDDTSLGIKTLLADNVYEGAFPLHEGNLLDEECLRGKLYSGWASMQMIFVPQPIDYIKDYFGVRVAFYFAWLEFYTKMLIPASICGIICFIYGLASYRYDDYYISVCDASLNITMCPTCDKVCDYWKLTDICGYTAISQILDNWATVIFTVFMSLWAVTYLELWKRHSAGICHRWGLSEIDADMEQPRPQYQAKIEKKDSRNPNGPKNSSFLRKVQILSSRILSYMVLMAMTITTVTAVVGVVLYQMSLLTSQFIYGDRNNKIKPLFVPVTAAIIDFIFIILLNHIFKYICEWITDLELHRTQAEYDESFTLKSFIFEFVNSLSPFFYIAFLKGKFVGYPLKHNRIFGLRQEECEYGGCFMELSIQVTTFMFCGQILNLCLEILTPRTIKWCKSYKRNKKNTLGHKKTTKIIPNELDENNELAESIDLFNEYLEMVIQYSFVTMFSVVLPIAALPALINNLFEIRVDAKKFIKHHQRPVPKTVKDIGVWYNIMDVIARVSVFTSAFIIAFSTNVIQEFAYNTWDAHEGTNFLDSSLAYFNTSHFRPDTAPINPSYNATSCRYFSYRNPPDHPMYPYKHNVKYWHVMMVRVIFIVAYQNAVGAIQTIVQWIIPDVPRHIRQATKKEANDLMNYIFQNHGNDNQEKDINQPTPVQENVNENDSV